MVIILLLRGKFQDIAKKPKFLSRFQARAECFKIWKEVSSSGNTEKVITKNYHSRRGGASLGDSTMSQTKPEWVVLVILRSVFAPNGDQRLS
jgi:hypothetical protein